MVRPMARAGQTSSSGVQVDVLEALAEHDAPGGHGGIAQAQEFQTGLDGDGHTADNGGLDDDGCANHGEDVAGNDGGSR